MRLGSDTAESAVLERFAKECERDDRVVAAFVGGSVARGAADEWSDLDIYVIVSDEGYDAFFQERREFMEALGKAVYLEDFNAFGFDMVLFTLEDGVEGELGMARESSFEHMHGGPHTVLVDKKGLLEGRTFPLYVPDAEGHRKTLEYTIRWFWDNLSHFQAGIGRGQLWTAYGSLDEMRMKCLKLARLKHSFDVEHSSYSGVEKYVPEDELQRLATTCCPLEAGAMIEAALELVAFYREIAPLLAEKHGVEYPADLERVVMGRVTRLGRKG